MVTTPTHLFIHTVDHYSATRTEDGVGGYSTEWVLNEENISCRIQPLSLWETLNYKRYDSMVDVKVYMEPRDIYQGDELRYGDIVYEVAGARDFDQLNTLMVVDCYTKKQPEDIYTLAPITTSPPP